MTILECLCVAVAVFWVLLALDVKRWWPRRLSLLEARRLIARSRGPAPGIGESIVAVVPARNEAGVLRETLPSLLTQGLSLRRIAVVDDRSTDGTGQFCREAAMASRWPEKVLVVSGEPTPPGWSGKLFALETGIQAVLRHDGRGALDDAWILFTDADVRHPPDSIEALHRTATDGGFDLVSVMVRLRSQGLWEKLLIPPFVYFFQLLYPFRRVQDPGSRVAAAAGGCILVRSRLLDLAGGLSAIRGEVIDDVALARRVKRVGGKCWLGTDPDMVSVRAYPHLRDIVEMVARTAFTQLGFSVLLVLGTWVFLGLFFAAPPVLAFLGAFMGSTPALLSGAASWALQSALFLPVVRHQGVGAAYSLTLPLAAVLYGYMTGLSAWRHYARGGVEWKGRKVG